MNIKISGKKIHEILFEINILSVKILRISDVNCGDISDTEKCDVGSKYQTICSSHSTYVRVLVLTHTLKKLGQSDSLDES